MERIVVGVDGSPHAQEALRWAAGEAGLRGWQLVAVLSWGYLDQHHVDGVRRFDPEYGEDDAKAALAAYVVQALGREAAGIAQEVACDLATPGLLGAATGAALLVVGSRGLGGFSELLLGSVSEHCLHHATGPVAIVRGAGEVAGRGRVLVGVDGSPTSLAALRWAFDEARARDAALEVLHAWRHPIVGGDPLSRSAFDPRLLEEAAEQLLERAIAQLDVDGFRRPVIRTVAEGGAAAALLAHSDTAELVVVGSRGVDGFAGLRLGSASHQLVRHATCPVIVIPAA